MARQIQLQGYAPLNVSLAGVLRQKRIDQAANQQAREQDASRAMEEEQLTAREQQAEANRQAQEQLQLKIQERIANREEAERAQKLSMAQAQSKETTDREDREFKRKKELATLEAKLKKPSASDRMGAWAKDLREYVQKKADEKRAEERVVEKERRAEERAAKQTEEGRQYQEGRDVVSRRASRINTLINKGGRVKGRGLLDRVLGRHPDPENPEDYELPEARPDSRRDPAVLNVEAAAKRRLWYDVPADDENWDKLNEAVQSGDMSLLNEVEWKPRPTE